MLAGDVSIAILNFMQVLDEQMALPRFVAEQRLYLGKRCGVDRAALGRSALFPV
jgi:ribosomal protein L7Ae-like RNA K-turn-binding protein